MLLRKCTDFKTRIGLGQVFGITGLIASGTLGNTSVLALFLDNSRVLDFSRGVLAGISGSMLGFSLVFSVAALAAIRSARKPEN